MHQIKLPTGTFEYDPSQLLGDGGFGSVFLGTSSAGSVVAVKKLHLNAATAAHRELRIADELKGRSFEHVLPFIDAGEDADTGDYYVVMPKAEGSLQQLIDTNGPFAPKDAASILLQITKGLLEVGELVHRDLKPGNVLFFDAKWRIADFGISRFIEEATASNTLNARGSVHYAAPEQWRSERATHATDAYALGCIAFCLLTGAPPFTRDPQAEHLTAPVPSFSCPEPRLMNLVNMCLRKVASSRPSLSRVRDLLSEIVTHPQLAQPVGSLGALAAAAARVSTAEQEVQARAAAQQTAREARLALAASGFEILTDNVERLWGKIHSQAPNATRSSPGRNRGLECQIGNGQLVVSRASHLDPGSFPHSRWDVVAFSKVTVSQRQPQYIWSASLWYVKIAGQSDYRWHEASYCSLHGHPYEPYAESPGRNADMAAGHVVCGVNFAFGPVAIDDEKEDEFHERWIWLLTKAAVGHLRSPSRLPFDWPPQLV